MSKNKRTLPVAVSLVSAVALAVVGIYIALTAAAPALVPRKVDVVKVKLSKQVDQVVIPSLGIQEGIYTGGVEVLEKGAWHRYPERGKPGSGNFILAAHRFVMGRWPGETVRKSPFYSLGKIKVGESLFVDWHGRRFSYKVTKVYQVKPNDANVEAPSVKHKLTLYTCTLNGSADGRLVIEAELVASPSPSLSGA